MLPRSLAIRQYKVYSFRASNFDRPTNLIITGYVPYHFWNEADSKAFAIIQSTLHPYRHELLLPNLSGIPILQQHGSADQNVPAFHSRRLKQLISEKNSETTTRYSELQGKGHWYDGMMTTEPLRKFYEKILKDPKPPALPLHFSIIIANPAEMGPKGGLIVEQLRTPSQFGKIEVFRDSSSATWVLKTSNIRRFAFTRGPYSSEGPSAMLVDGQEMGPIPRERLLSCCCICAADGTWSVS